MSGDTSKSDLVVMELQLGPISHVSDTCVYNTQTFTCCYQMVCKDGENHTYRGELEEQRYYHFEEWSYRGERKVNRYIARI